MMEPNLDPYNFDLRDLFNYLERLGLIDSLLKKAQQENQSAQKCQQPSKKT
jgi:hypothetical protein